MKDDYIIYIPTRGRIEHQPTYDFLSKIPGVADRVYLVCRDEELDEHYRRGRSAISRPSDLPIHGVWEWMKNNCSMDKFFIVDDDLVFYRRMSEDDWHLRKCDTKDGKELIDSALDALDNQGFIHGTLSARQGNNNQPAPYGEVGRANAFHFFKTKAVQSANVNMSASGLHDIHTTLSLLRLGYPNLVITEFCWNQTKGSNAPGGCSIYRDGDWQKTEVLKLKELHPDFVSVVEKKPKVGWGDGMKTRTDVRVSWVKAYNSSQGK